MLQNVKDYGHPLFRCTSLLGDRTIKSKGGGKTTKIHFNGSTENIELLLQKVTSVNQLSLFGVVADMVAELPVDQRAPGKPVKPGQLDKQEILTQPLLSQNLQANKERQGNRLQEDEERRPEVIQTMLRSRFETCRSWTLLRSSSVTERRRKSIFMPRIHVASRSKRNSNKRMDPNPMYVLAQSRT